MLNGENETLLIPETNMFSKEIETILSSKEYLPKVSEIHRASLSKNLSKVKELMGEKPWIEDSFTLLHAAAMMDDDNLINDLVGVKKYEIEHKDLSVRIHEEEMNETYILLILMN